MFALKTLSGRNSPRVHTTDSLGPRYVHFLLVSLLYTLPLFPQPLLELSLFLLHLGTRSGIPA